MCQLAYSEPEVIEVQVDKDGYKQTCVVEIWQEAIANRWIFKVNYEVLRQSNEGIHAILGLALMQLRDRWHV
jgi:hypothetical protein